jgi:hypothetical protein
MPVLLTNNANTVLASSLAIGATTLSVTAGTGGKFPVPVNGVSWFPVTVVKASGALEIMRCVGRAGDVLSVQRAMEGTTAQAFNAGDRVELRLTNQALSEFGQLGNNQTWSGANGFAQLISLSGGANSAGSVTLINGVPESPRLVFANSARSINIDLSTHALRIFSENAGVTMILAANMADESFVVFGKQVWHTGNLNPAAYLPVGGTAANAELLDGRDSTGFVIRRLMNDGCEGTVMSSGSPPAIASAAMGTTPLEIQNSSNPAASAIIQFHRGGSHALFFGLDTDNQVKIGGASLGANAYVVWHDQNANLRVFNAIAGAAVGGIGSYAFARNLWGATVGGGAVIAGTSLAYSDSGNAGGITLPGSWRCLGECRSGYSSLFLRYA